MICFMNNVGYRFSLRFGSLPAPSESEGTPASFDVEQIKNKCSKDDHLELRSVPMVSVVQSARDVLRLKRPFVQLNWTLQVLPS